MRKHPILCLVAALVVLVAGYFVVRHLLITDEDRVRTAIDKLISAAETDYPLMTQVRLSNALSDKYAHRGEPEGDIPKDIAIAYILRIKETEYQEVKVEIRTMNITITGDTARVEITGRITAAEKGKPGHRTEILTDAGRNRVVLDLAKENGDWKVTGSRRFPYKLP